VFFLNFLNSGVMKSWSTEVTWLANVTLGDVDPLVSCHVSSCFMIFRDLLCQLELDILGHMSSPYFYHVASPGV
jgi:hypothetical protein